MDWTLFVWQSGRVTCAMQTQQFVCCAFVHLCLSLLSAPSLATPFRTHFAHDRTFYRPVTVMQSSSTAADKRLFTSTQHTFSSHINLKIRAAWKCDNSPNPIRSIDRQAKPGRSSFAQLCFIVFAPPARPTPTHNTNCTMHSTVRNTHKHTQHTHDHHSKVEGSAMSSGLELAAVRANVNRR